MLEDTAVRDRFQQFTQLARELLTDFREVFVTPLLTDDEVKKRGGFLFDEMVKTRNIDQYVSMKTYIQWPNELSTYDTAKYEWTWRVKP